MLAGRVGDEPVLLSSIDGQLHAVGGVCTHYSAALAGGLAEGGTIRCPLHHACFSLKTGEALRAPAFAPLPRWRVEVRGDLVFVRDKSDAALPAAAIHDSGVSAVVIVGGGAAGFACAAELRRLGFAGRLTMLSADADPPCDRPNLSKDYLAGTAPEDWIPLRDAAFYRDARIDLHLGADVASIDTVARQAVTRAGRSFGYDRLLLATGSDPVRLTLPGFDRENVLALRSLADARAIIARTKPGARAVVIGSNFIGLEAAAALRTRGVEVEIVSTDFLPFGRLFGREIGQFLQRLYERNGVTFHLSCQPLEFDGRTLKLGNGKSTEADFVLEGIGVRPRTGIVAPTVAMADGYLVDDYLATTAPGIYAAGDVAAYRDPLTRRPVRIEHWVTAQRQGQTAAANMLGAAAPFTAVPFFWTEHFGVTLRYVGHSRHWDDIRIEGDVEGGDFIARFYERGQLRASAACGRDRELLEDERMLERMIAGENAPTAKSPMAERA